MPPVTNKMEGAEPERRVMGEGVGGSGGVESEGRAEGGGDAVMRLITNSLMGGT